MNRRVVLAVAAALATAACSSPDDESGEMRLELVNAPASATPGGMATFPLIVRVVNGDRAPVAGVPVSWHVKTGGGTLRVSADTSGVDGLAAAQWRPGLLAGRQEVGVSIYDEPALTITVNTDAFRADKIVTSFRSGCGVRAGAVWCWSYGPWGDSASIRRVMSPIRARDVALNGSFLCVLDEAGAVHCQQWESNASPDQSVPVTGLPPMSSIAGGHDGPYCGLAEGDGTPWCWGRGTWTASQVSATLELSRISAGASGACGLTPTGNAWCWGIHSAEPELLAGGHAFRDISVGLFTSCAIEAPAALYCWDTSNPVPVFMNGIDAAQVALGHSRNIYNGATGATGFYALPSEQPQYYTIATLPLPARQVSAGDDTPCAIAYDHAVYCLGSQDNIDAGPTWSAVVAPSP